MSAASSATSFYEDQNDNFETATEDTPLNTSSESAPPPPNPHFAAAGRQKHSSRDPRDEIILEFLRSEEIFLSNTQLCIDTFIIPIRTENSRSWIGGVPTNISRLLDWFEDIANLHLAVYQSLESSAAMQEGDGASAGLAGYLYDFVGKLHVYQPYLVSLADVLEEVAALVGDGRSDFGEFIRIQEKQVETAGWTFEQLLMEPVNRLAVYQDLFSVSISLHFHRSKLTLTPPSGPAGSDTARPSRIPRHDVAISLSRYRDESHDRSEGKRN
jgi:hypothetical protein